MLPFAAEPQRVAARHPAQCVANLVAVELCALGDTEVRAVLQGREADFIACGQSRGIRDRVVRAKSGYGVQEPVPVENEAVGQARRNNPRPVGQGRIEAVQRGLPIGCSALRLSQAPVVDVERTVEGIAHRKAIFVRELVIGPSSEEIVMNERRRRAPNN